jgi:hypothetical protein
MTTTVKRITLALTKEDERQLLALMMYLGEGQSQVIRRAIACFFSWHYLDRQYQGQERLAKEHGPDQEPHQTGSAI